MRSRQRPAILEEARLIAPRAFRDSFAFGSVVLTDRTTAPKPDAETTGRARPGAKVGRQRYDITREQRAALKGQRPVILWFTGLSGAGKSTIANLLDRQLYELGRHSFVLDGDNVRQGLSRDLGFGDAHRVENIRRVAELARLMADAGLIVLACLISPFRIDRAMAREIAGEVPFFEVFIDAPLETCESRDPKGLYGRARAGEVVNFTGISSRYEPPEAPEIRLRTDVHDADSCVAAVLRLLAEYIEPLASA